MCHSYNADLFLQILVYYIPIWFQAIKGATPVKSGIMNIPM